MNVMLTEEKDINLKKHTAVFIVELMEGEDKSPEMVRAITELLKLLVES